MTKRGWFGLKNSMDYLAVGKLRTTKYLALTEAELRNPEMCVNIGGDGEKVRYICGNRGNFSNYSIQ